MIKKSDVFKYLVIGFVFVGLIGFLFFLNRGFTGYVVYTDDIQGEFDLGTYSNVEWNGSAVVLSEDNLTGAYTSQIFDAGADAIWNNISWTGNEPSLEYLYVVDGQADIWRSSDGTSWSLFKSDYNGAEGNGATYMIVNSSGSLFILYDQDFWKSDDYGENWIKVNDDINPGASNNGFVLDVDSNNNIFVLDGGKRVLKSTDSGVSFTNVNDTFTTRNAGGIAIDLNDNIFVIDNAADVWQSTDTGITWTLVNDDYNGATSNDITDLTVNSSGSLFALNNQDVWVSDDSGVSWTKINEDYNGGSDSDAGKVIYVDTNDYVYIADGGEDIYQSTDFGVSFLRLVENMNGANGNVNGLTSISESSSLSLQIKSCNDNACSGKGWTVVSGDSPQDLSEDNNQYFQYIFTFTSPDSSITPELQDVTIDYSLVNSAPTIGASYGYNESLALNFSVNDAEENIDSCWYNLNAGGNITLAGCTNTTIDVPEESNTLIVYVNDTQGEEAGDSAVFNVEVGAPTIVLHFPIDVYFDVSAVEFNYTPTDIDLDSCELWGDFTGDFEILVSYGGILQGILS